MPRLKICLSPKLPNAPLVPESANLLVTVGSGAGAAGAAFEPRINSFQGDFEGASTSPAPPRALSFPPQNALYFVHGIGLTADRSKATADWCQSDQADSGSATVSSAIAG